ncbi:hypothetical protein LTR10_012036 [Elasticomyces elasticus]|nr:hypothetical protein LTR10_012036 [Elasticomyces elasticus]KAK4968978.1 hypothetical protein LTR42_009257 [Elasticomyces elasticus]
MALSSSQFFGGLAERYRTVMEEARAECHATSPGKDERWYEMLKATSLHNSIYQRNSTYHRCNFELDPPQSQKNINFTINTMRSSASAQVFGLPGLLESVLLQLPMKDLLLAQKICKDFKNVIDSSPTIQRALCFILGAFSDVNYVGRPHQQKYKTRTLKTGYALNPLITTYSYDLFLSGAFRPGFPGCSQRAMGSYSRMLLTQPPSDTTLLFRVWEVCRGWLPNKLCTVSAPCGESFGDLVQRFKKAGHELDRKGFAICTLLEITDGLKDTGVDKGGEWDL